MKLSDIYTSKTAFTLAEVLITLGIIGIVAAMTLPTLIQNYQQGQTLVQLKKADTELHQALKMAEVDHENIATWDFSTIGDNKTKYFFDNYLKPYLKIAEVCEFGNNNCWGENIYALNGTLSAYVLKDKRIAFNSNSGYSVLLWISASGGSASIYIDVNGAKKRPNTLGKDIFAYGIWFKDTDTYKGGLYPQGGAVNNLTREELVGNNINACSKNKTGLYCSGLIVIDGWQISDDYP